MAKKKEVLTVIKLQLMAGQATPAPPVGPALGQHGVNIGQFVSQFNEKTKKDAGIKVGCEITVYNDRQRSFEIIIKSPPASVLLKVAAGVAKGSSVPNRDKVGKVTRAQLVDIAKKKKDDLNARNVDHAIRIIAGTARSMGIEVAE